MDFHCAEDSPSQAKLIAGCTRATEFWNLIRPTPGSTAVFLNIGANKGYEIASFVQRWAPERGLSAGSWFHAIKRYATTSGSQHLHWNSRGACKESSSEEAAVARAHELGGLHVHAFELNQRTARLLEHLARDTRIADVVSVHRMPVSDHVGSVCTQQGPVGYERGGIQYSQSHAARKCTSHLNATTVDAFVASTQLESVFHVEVDTEGHDAAVYARPHSARLLANR